MLAEGCGAAKGKCGSTGKDERGGSTSANRCSWTEASMSVPIAFRTTMVMKMGVIAAAVEVVAGTGCVEAVRVFDLGPRTGSMSRSPGDRIVGRTCEGD